MTARKGQIPEGQGHRPCSPKSETLTQTKVKNFCRPGSKSPKPTKKLLL